MKDRRNIAALLAAAVLLIVLGVAVSFRTFSQIEAAVEARQHVRLAITGANDLLSELKDAESSQLGYSLTGDAVILQTYLAVYGRIASDLAQLRALVLADAASQRRDALVPLIDDKLARMAQIVELRRTHKLDARLTAMATSRGKHQMDLIVAETQGFIQIQEGEMLQYDALFTSNRQRLFVMLVALSVLLLLFAFWLAHLIYRQAQQRLKDLGPFDIRHTLDLREATNSELKRAYVTLRDSEEHLAVTLNSIGDAVIVTDASACVTRLNPIAEQLTGWTQAQASGRAVAEIFRIINQESRLPATIPVMETLARGTVQGLANHTVLIARDGSECAIADSCAPIRNRDQQVVGAVLVFRNVTEEYAAQQALRDSAALIQTVLNTVADGIITFHARGGIVETVNPAAEQMFGYTAAELVGREFSLLIPELDRQQHDGNGALEYYRASDEARANCLGREVVGQHMDGSTFPLEIAVSEMWLGGQRYFTGILRDISARKQAEEALLKAGALQNAIFNSANFSSIATDAKGVIQIFNVGAEHMLGYAAEDVVNKITPADISDPQEVIARAKALSEELATPIAPGFEALIFKASRGIEDIYELTYIRKDSSRFPAVVSVTALRDPQNVIIGYLLIGVDNTARKRVEAERTLLDQALQDKNTELENAKSLAEKANLAKSDFLSSMSHELRTPLGAILGFAQLIESGTPAPTPTQKRSVDQILKAGWYLLDLINEILDLALIESGKMSLSLEPVSLIEVMQECEVMIEPQAQKRDIRVTFAPFASSYYVNADETRVKQVLINLLSNAIKYNTVGGSVNVTCSEYRPNSVRISVRDTGAGLTPEQLEQLFQPFNRLGQKVDSKEGTGIGLVVSRRLVELMGGNIGVESTVGEGSLFWVELRLTTEPLSHVNTMNFKVIAEQGVNTGTHLHTLLYVEDNPANLMLVEDILARRSDICLLSARDGKRGIQMARASLPDIILMDINLPGISGLEALKILIEDPATAHIPVIALSANAIPRDIEKGLEAGFYRYLTKPIKVVEFLETLDLALKFAKTTAARAAERDES